MLDGQMTQLSKHFQTAALKWQWWLLSTHYMIYNKEGEERELIDGKSTDTRMMIMSSASERILWIV